MKYIALGMVAKAFGLKGEVRLKPYNPRTTWFESAEGVWLQAPGGEPEYRRILLARWHKDSLVLAFEGVRDRDGAEALQGLEAVAPEDRLEPLDEGEFYWHQLVGLMVETTGGERVGAVVRLEETAPGLGGNDVLVVAGAAGEVLVPFGGDAVASVDVAGGKIVVDAEYVTRES